MTDTISKESAKTLAIIYSAFNEAVRYREAHEMLFYARYLLDAQEGTGIILRDEDLLKELIDVLSKHYLARDAQFFRLWW